jgi:hypothetical protein
MDPISCVSYNCSKPHVARMKLIAILAKGHVGRSGMTLKYGEGDTFMMGGLSRSDSQASLRPRTGDLSKVK